VRKLWMDLIYCIMRLKLLLATVLLGHFGQIYACKCNPPSKDAGFKSSDLVIYGKVIRTELISFANTIDDSKIGEFKERLKGDKNKLQLLESDWILKVEIIVEKTVKGKVPQDTVIIYTARRSASCGYRFTKGLSYHVFAERQSYLNVFFFNPTFSGKDFGRENTFWTNQCTPTSEYHQ
jgi:hypothetical protein